MGDGLPRLVKGERICEEDCRAAQPQPDAEGRAEQQRGVDPQREGGIRRERRLRRRRLGTGVSRAGVSVRGDVGGGVRRDECGGWEGAHEGRVGGEQRGHELQHREGELRTEDRAPEDGELEHRHHLHPQPRPPTAATAAAAVIVCVITMCGGGGGRRVRRQRARASSRVSRCSGRRRGAACEPRLVLERLGALLEVQLRVRVGAAACEARHELGDRAPEAEHGEEERGDEQGRGVGRAERKHLEGGEWYGDLLIHDEGGEAAGDEEHEQRREEVARRACGWPRPPLEAAAANGGERREGEDER